jgi:hypothetical protein
MCAERDLGANKERSVANITTKLGHPHAVDVVTTQDIVVPSNEAMRARERSIRIATVLMRPIKRMLYFQLFAIKIRRIRNKFLLLFFRLVERVLSESVNDKRIGGGRWHYPVPPNEK